MPAADEPRVLVVDDEKNYLSDFLTLFSKKFNLVTASGGQEALDLLAKEAVAVVVSDQRMPKMSGSEFLAQVSQRYPSTIRILLTGYSDIDAVVEAVNKGEIYRYVSKDTPLKEIEIVVRQAVEKFRLEETNRQLLWAKKRLIKSLAVRENLSMVGAFGHEVHQKMESLVVNLFNYVFQMGKEANEKTFLVEFHKLQGALTRLRELSSFSERLRVSSVGTQKGGLNEMIQEAARRASEIVKKNGGCEIQFNLDDHLPTLSVQRYSFMRVLKELLENAILFGPKEGRKIKIRSRYVKGSLEGTLAEEPAVVIEIEDNGSGIPPVEISKAFAPFYTTLSALSPPEGSVPPPPDEYNLSPYHHYGFGLPIAQWIVSVRHNGTVDLNSRPGKGTTATVTLPLN